MRARPVAGDHKLAQRFAEARRKVLCRPRDETKLLQDVADMRQKMLAAQKPHADHEFDIKHDRGGIVDIEFMVQYWVLRGAHSHPALVEHTDNIAILEALVAAGLLEQTQSRLLADAYTHYLSAVYRLKLMQTGPYVDRDQLQGYPDKVAAIWNTVFAQADKG